MRRAALPVVTWLTIEALYPVAFAIGLLAPIASTAPVARPGRRAPVLSSRS